MARGSSLNFPAAMDGSLIDMPANPAGLCLYDDSPFIRFSLYLNPIGSFTALQSLQEGRYADSHVDGEDFSIPARILMKGIGFSYEALNMGIIFGEQLPLTGRKQDRVFEYFSIFDGYYSRAFIKLDMHSKVAVGGAAEIFAGHDRIDAVGYSYGVLLKPGKLHAGVLYYSLPEGYEEVFLQSNRIVSETVNAGFSWQSDAERVKLYGGVRNLNESKSSAFMEPQFAVEFTPYTHVSLRAGYSLAEGNEHLHSFGIGLVDLNELRSLQDQIGQKEYLLEYSCALLTGNIRLHSLSIHFRLF